MKNEIIEMKDVSLEYSSKGRKTKALSKINLRINRSDFAVILGPSGCGKTTLLNLIAGFIKPLKGEVLKDGKRIERAGKDRGVVFQSANLYPWLNVRENIGFPLKIQGYSKTEREKLVKKYLEKIELSPHSLHYPEELSGGMKQRVALARTLITKPDVVLLDEPFGALDAITKSAMHRFIRKMWAKEGKTFLLITHDIDEALKIANRVFVMQRNPGRIVKEFRPSYYERLLENASVNVEEEEEYRGMKREILQIIDEACESSVSF